MFKWGVRFLMWICFAVVAAEVVLNRETLHLLSEVAWFLIFSFIYLRCALVFVNTQYVDIYEQKGESYWI